MSGTQLALIQIDNYGPWTVSPTPRPEPDIQSLQSRLYADLCQQIGNHGGYVFYTRFDNMIAVTNGFDAAMFRRIQESVRNRYPVTVSIGAASDPSPGAALERATAQLQTAGSAQDGSRREVLAVEDERGAETVTIAHFDLVDATGRYTDRDMAYEVFIEIERAFGALMRYFYRTHGALSFFVGGDNFIAVCPDISTEAYRSAIEHVREETGIDLQVGVGRGHDAREAGMAAKHALETCRAEARPVTVQGARAQTGD